MESVMVDRFDESLGKGVYASPIAQLWEQNIHSIPAESPNSFIMTAIFLSFCLVRM